jgi:transcription initiation factor IIE alpha subunit
MQAGDYAGALRLLERAVQKLQGSNSLDEAYADYNLAFTRFQLGNCDGVLDLLDRSEAIQGQRAEIDRLRQQAQENC